MLFFVQKIQKNQKRVQFEEFVLSFFFDGGFRGSGYFGISLLAFSESEKVAA